MLDPLIYRIAALCFAVLFLVAGMHKIANVNQFRANLSAYKILPGKLISPVTRVLPVFEILLGLIWAANLFQTLSAVLTALILSSYTMAIGINLARGRNYIDCGCGFSSSTRTEGQQLSTGLLLRNIALIVTAGIAGITSTDRLLGYMDYFSIVIASIIVVLAYMAFNQLLMNDSIIRSWRVSHG